ncbi:MAG TPA: GIY-YIG nuclease family protein [Pyrinomonadaceae bacterium]|nr:GIY-YIG nuclease family protein [Pyrinomonadaceae bacterium]
MDKKAAKLYYKASRRPMGIFLIRNLVNDKVFVGSSMDLPAMFNRIRFQLFGGAHPNKELESDWKLFGADKFTFEVLEAIVPRDDVNYDYKADLETLEDLWLEKLEPYGEKGYNEKKKTREERLRMIAANRKN